jgi:surface antigen
VLGGVVGGVAGGAIGGDVAEGSAERDVAIVVGTVIGAAIGSEVGRRMDKTDRSCVGHTLELADYGQSVKWTNPNTRVTYQLTPLDAEQGGEGCRRFRLIAHGSFGLSEGRTVACTDGSGVWQSEDDRLTIAEAQMLAVDAPLGACQCAASRGSMKARPTSATSPACGVSQATVSRALRNSPCPSRDPRARTIARQLSYRTDRRAAGPHALLEHAGLAAVRGILRRRPDRRSSCRCWVTSARATAGAA